MYFSTADVEVAFWLPPPVSFCVSVCTSMGGISGAFLLLPFQMSVLGFTTPAVSATNQLYNIVAIPSGVYRYVKEGRMVWPLTWVIIAGTLPGVLLGAIIRVVWLPDPTHFKVFAGLVLCYMGVRMFRDVRKTAGGCDKGSGALCRKMAGLAQHAPGKPVTPAATSPSQGLPRVQVLSWSLRRLRYTFFDQEYDISVPGLFGLCVLVGVVGGIYGVGGGAFIAPFLVAYYRQPVYTVAGASLLATFSTSVAGVIFYQLIGWIVPGHGIAPDWKLGLLLGLGGMAGMYLGASLQKRVSARRIKWMLTVIVLCLGLKYLLFP